MCGILFISKNNYSKIQSFKALETMNHRGPDNINYKIKNNNYFGHVRLSIIDLNERSNQPFESNGLLIIYNGEVYNYKELIKDHNLIVKTESDTEVVLEMYRKYGSDALKYLNGMFSFVIHDIIHDTIFIARDRLGIKPLYYRFEMHSLVVSSEIEPILTLKEDSFDEFGIRQYKKLRMTIKGYTIYKNIKQFPPGHFYDGKNLIRYWDLEIHEKASPTNDLLNDLILDAVSIRTRSDVPVGSFLSGGLDSTILSYLLKPTHTWTVGFKNMNEFKWSELANAGLNSNHCKVLINYNEFLELGKKMIKKRKEPLSVPNEILIYKMTMAVKKENTVVLSGEGADELFWGYDRIFKWANKLNDKIDIKQFDQYYCYGSDKDEEVIDFALEGLPGKKPIDKIAYYFQIIHLQGLLRRLDNSTMLCSVEARVPFVDHRLVELMAGTPFDWRMGKSFKEPLKNIYSSLIPPEILQREKIGFPVPLDNIFPLPTNKTGMDKWLMFNLKELFKFKS
ncbi:MAG: asparagine synthase (glutamine-hydrolyzing) [Gammaproteobacteria bacterium]|nr:asparagine synthase (glutamine-hydrolyzing) [Gammaproteobacteria bacterium]